MSLCKTCNKNYRMPKESYCPVCLVKQLKSQIKNLEKDFNDLRDAFFNNTLSQKEFIGIVEEIVQRGKE